MYVCMYVCMFVRSFQYSRYWILESSCFKSLPVQTFVSHFIARQVFIKVMLSPALSRAPDAVSCLFLPRTPFFPHAAPVQIKDSELCKHAVKNNPGKWTKTDCCSDQFLFVRTCATWIFFSQNI